MSTTENPAQTNTQKTEEQVEQVTEQLKTTSLTTKPKSTLNPEAKEFTFNPNAVAFIPKGFTPAPKKETKKEEPKKEEPKKKVESKEKKQLRMDTREHLNIVFIGHVDAGKSTLGGRILVDSGMVDQRTIEKYEREAKEKNRESWFLAYVLDASEEEREKGKTVEVARAHFTTKTKRYTILDAPGHRSYVPSMIGGASQADVAVLVISARRGEFETGFERDGQTREHTTLAKTLGIRKLVAAINKMDDPTVNWSKERYDEIIGKISPFFKSVGFDPKKSVTFLPVAALSGQNIHKRVSESVCPWYKSDSLIEVLDKMSVGKRNTEAPLRIPIIDKYKDMGSTVALGKIEQGKITVGDKVLINPQGKEAEVLKIVLSQEEEVDVALAGDNVNVYLKGVDTGDFLAGDVICDKDNPCIPIREFLGEFLVLDKPIFSAGYKPMLHVHTQVVGCTITRLVSKIDKKTGQRLPDKIKYAKSGDIILAKIKTEIPICVEKFEVLQQMGRFTLREGQTVAIGKITGIKPLKKTA